MRDQQEFTDLLKANLPAIHRFVLGMVGNHFDVEDIVQETALKAFIHFAEFRGEAKFRTWLASIARNEVRGKRRRESMSRMSYFESHELEQIASPRSTESPYCQYQEQEFSRILEDAIASLHASESDVIRLRAFDGCDVADVAHRLSISIPATKSRYHRAVHHLSLALTRRIQKPTLPARRTGSPRECQPVPVVVRLSRKGR
jgi:RNA polymerase sigma-70 factor (ECF subfamily)